MLRKRRLVEQFLVEAFGEIPVHLAYRIEPSRIVRASVEVIVYPEEHTDDVYHVLTRAEDKADRSFKHLPFSFKVRALQGREFKLPHGYVEPSFSDTQTPRKNNERGYGKRWEKLVRWRRNLSEKMFCCPGGLSESEKIAKALLEQELDIEEWRLIGPDLTVLEKRLFPSETD